MIVIGNTTEFPNINKPVDMFSAEEIDQLESGMLSGLGERELVAPKQKLSDTFDWLEAGNWKAGDYRWEEWEKRLDRISDMMDSIEEILHPEERNEDEEGDRI